MVIKYDGKKMNLRKGDKIYYNNECFIAYYIDEKSQKVWEYQSEIKKPILKPRSEGGHLEYFRFSAIFNSCNIERRNSDIEFIPNKGNVL